MQAVFLLRQVYFLDTLDLQTILILSEHVSTRQLLSSRVETSSVLSL